MMYHDAQARRYEEEEYYQYSREYGDEYNDREWSHQEVEYDRQEDYGEAEDQYFVEGEEEGFYHEGGRLELEAEELEEEDHDSGDESIPPLLEDESDDEEDEEEYVAQARKKKDVSPYTMAQVKKVNDSEGIYMFKTLFDSGSTLNMVKKSALPRNVKLFKIKQGEGIQTTMGSMGAQEYVKMEQISLPEFSPNRYIPETVAVVFDNPDVRYDWIMGRRLMKEIGLKLDFEKDEIEWIDKKVSFRTTDWINNEGALEECFEPKSFRTRKAEEYEAFATEITAAKYKKADLKEVIDKQVHLDDEQRNGLLAVFEKHEDLFNGEVGISA